MHILPGFTIWEFIFRDVFSCLLYITQSKPRAALSSVSSQTVQKGWWLLHRRTRTPTLKLHLPFIYLLTSASGINSNGLLQYLYFCRKTCRPKKWKIKCYRYVKWSIVFSWTAGEVYNETQSSPSSLSESVSLLCGSPEMLPAFSKVRTSVQTDTLA